MLRELKKEYYLKNVHLVTVDYTGIVIESDSEFVGIQPGICLSEVHPFFYCMESVVNSPQNNFSFHCVHLDLGKERLIADIEIRKKKGIVFVTIQDLTQHYISYQSIAQARNESIINEELVVLKNLELRAREHFKDTFIRNFSHELRNPLTSIVSLTNLLQSTSLNSEQREIVRFLKQSNVNLKALLEDILSISMISSGKLQLREHLFSLLELLKLIEFTYRTKAKSKKLDFKLTISDNVPDHLEGDRLRLFQILTNLLDNALKYTDKGYILLEVSLNQKHAQKASLHFQIADTGNGIAEEHRETIFESFTQIDSGGNEKGAGLGLSIVKGLVELMEGKIKVQSRLGKGTQFYFDVLMKYPLPSTVGLWRKKQGLKSVKSIKKRDRSKILLVEDDIRIQMLLFKTLIASELFYVNLINDGALVMEELLKNEYDAILMDVNLPNINGDDLTKVIRDFPYGNLKNLPILGLTANAFKKDVESYRKAGMDAVLTKPFDTDELVATLLKLIKQKRKK